MKYVRLKWNHENPDEPVYIFSELDDADTEVRKIECFRNGFCDVATKVSSSGSAELMTTPLPDLAVLAKRDPEFEPMTITKEEFDAVWAERQYKVD